VLWNILISGMKAVIGVQDAQGWTRGRQNLQSVRVWLTRSLNIFKKITLDVVLHSNTKIIKLNVNLDLHNVKTVGWV
jgi:hypothetical protein